MKAYLVFCDIAFPFTHNLKDLIIKAAQTDPIFAEYAEKAETLTPFAVQIRYPDDELTPSMADAQEALETAAEIRKLVLSKIG